MGWSSIWTGLLAAHTHTEYNGEDKWKRGKMYDDDVMDEYTVSYDFRDYDYEERDGWEPAEIEEFSQCEDKEAFIEHVRKQTD